jgi:hypothetical protein
MMDELLYAVQQIGDGHLTRPQVRLAADINAKAQVKLTNTQSRISKWQENNEQ